MLLSTKLVKYDEYGDADGFTAYKYNWIGKYVKEVNYDENENIEDWIEYEY